MVRARGGGFPARLVVSMIYLYSGSPGSGKTLHAVSQILQNLRRDLPVIANFPINGEYAKHPEMFRYGDNSEVTPDVLMEASKAYWEAVGGHVKEDSMLLVLDECQLIFNTRDWRNNKRWISFFTQHRKMGYRVILIAQNLDMLDKQIRPLIEYEYKHRKMVNAGFFGYVISFLMGSRFLYRKEWAQVRKMGKGVSVGWEFGQYSKKVYKAYDTFKTW